jgi:hypothetical protein
MMELLNMKYDIVVVGGGAGGLPAALAAARRGASVLLVEKNGYLGGNAASGLPLLGFMDRNGKTVVGGIAQEMIDSLAEMGGTYGHCRCPLHNSVTVIDPELYKFVALEKCNEAGVNLLLHCQAIDVDIENKQIKRISVMGKTTRIEIEAKVIIDATGDGDIAYLSGASYEKGSKGNGNMQPPTVMFSLANFNPEKFYQYLDTHPEDLAPPESMHIIDGYNTNFFRKNPSHVFLGLKNLLQKLSRKGLNPLKRDTVIYINSTKEGQIYVNSTRVLNFDATDPRELTRGEIEGCYQIIALVEMLKEHVPGFENCYISSINHEIGIRESRRINGIKRLTVNDVFEGTVPEDTIALGSYKVDIHSGSGEGTILREVKQAYGIPLGCLISADIEGLLISGRCISMDAEAMASVRVMPTCMAIGQAAGVCAAIAVKEGILPSQVNAEKVVRILKMDGAILEA